MTSPHCRPRSANHRDWVGPRPGAAAPVGLEDDRLKIPPQSDDTLLAALDISNNRSNSLPRYFRS